MRINKTWVFAAAGASALAAMYCFGGYAMTGSFAMARGEHSEQVRNTALLWGLGTLTFAAIAVALVVISIRTRR